MLPIARTQSCGLRTGDSSVEAAGHHTAPPYRIFSTFPPAITFVKLPSVRFASSSIAPWALGSIIATVLMTIPLLRAFRPMRRAVSADS